MTMTWQDQIDGIAGDNLSGAAEVASNTARALGVMCEEEPFDSRETLFEVVQSVARRLIASQAGMAPLVTLLNRVFFAATSAVEAETALQALIDAAYSFITETEEARRQVVRKATPLIPAGVTALTHTHSATVAMTLIQAAQSGRNPRVICLEARPLCEGRHIALELAEAGLEVVFAVDAAAYAKLLKCDLVLLGADSLTDKGVISKIGTAGITLCAQTLGVPVYVLADTSKIWPAGLGSPPISLHSPDEVWEDAPENIRVDNHYFDLAPWRGIAGVATERGLLTPEELCTISREKPVHRHLRTIIAEVRSTI
jgi:translation initiation factor 2B subunit (eIF-2B alpha/beta/delta family)